jgi:hypothetical protein
VLTLAEQIIAAIPDRIKVCMYLSIYIMVMMLTKISRISRFVSGSINISLIYLILLKFQKESSEEMSPCESQDSSMISSDPSENADFSFEFSDRNYR